MPIYNLGGLNLHEKGSDVASGDHITLGEGDYFDITGTTNISTIASKGVGAQVTLHFDGTLTLNHSANLVLPGATGLYCLAGSEVTLIEYAPGQWRLTNFTSSAGIPGALSDGAYGGSWNNDTRTAASRNAIYDKMQTRAALGANSDITSLTALSGQQTIPTINLTGGQIVFPADQSASANANTLDDYEEGSYTPAIYAGQWPITANYNTRFGSYTKIGDNVSVNAFLALSNKGEPVGANLSINLPFTVGASGSCAVVQTTIGVAPGQWIDAYAESSTAVVLFLKHSTAGFITNLDYNDIVDTSIFFIQANYKVA